MEQNRCEIRFGNPLKTRTNPAIGLDFGTTSCCIAAWLNGKAVILANENGGLTTPSYVSFTQAGRCVGDSAKDQAVKNPKNTVYDVKRLLGHNTNEFHIIKNMKYCPFKVETAFELKPMIYVFYKHQFRKFCPEEICSMILTKMKNIAENYFGFPIQDIVITFPDSFSYTQKEMVRDACTISGLNPLMMLSESSAAAITYGLNLREKTAKNILVYNFGGGYLDVSILQAEDFFYEIKAKAGNPNLGGNDFDNKLVDFCTAELLKQAQIVIPTHTGALTKLKIACEKAKRILSSQLQTTIELDNLFEGINFTTTISRSQFEAFCQPLFKACIYPVEKVLQESGLRKGQIDEIILVGGSTRIPKINQILKQFFNGKEPNKQLNSDEAAASGAAAYASILQPAQRSAAQNLLLVNIVPFSLGIATLEGQMTILIPKNAIIPVVKKSMFSYKPSTQPWILQVFEGDNLILKDNHILGELMLENLGGREAPQVEIQFEISSEGLLTVVASNITTGVTRQIPIKINKQRLSSEEIQLMKMESDKVQQEDELEKLKIKSKNDLENLINQLKIPLQDEEIRSKFSGRDVARLENLIMTAHKWFEDHSNENRKTYDIEIAQILFDYKPILQRILKDTKDRFIQSSLFG